MSATPWHKMRETTRQRLLAERHEALHPEWTVSEECRLEGRAVLRPGVEFKVHGERGRVFRFVRLVETPRGSWIDAYGGTRDPNGERQLRAFHPARVAVVLRSTPLATADRSRGGA